MSTALREGVRHLESTARISLLVLALASGVYTYIGARDLLDGSPTAVFFAAVIYSTAVTVGIFVFWSYMLTFLPHLTEGRARAMMAGAMALGCAMIIAISSWLNASALAGSAAVEQHMSSTLAGYERDLERAHGNALAAQGLAPDIQMAASRFGQLAETERTGALTGTIGSGTVVQLLSQMSAQLTALSREVTASGDRVKSLYDEAGRKLSAMRELISGAGPVAPRADAFGTQATALVGILGQLQQASIAPAVKRAASDFSAGFIAPAADGRSADLVGRQTEVVGRVQSVVATQSRALAQAADEVLARPAVTPTRYERLSSAEAVLRYAGDFLPAWAGAISVDLLPGVLVLVLCVVHAAIRREGEIAPRAEAVSAAQMLAALKFARELEVAHAALRSPPLQPESDADVAAEADAEEEKVTPLHTRPAKRD